MFDSGAVSTVHFSNSLRPDVNIHRNFANYSSQAAVIFAATTAS